MNIPSRTLLFPLIERLLILLREHVRSEKTDPDLGIDRRHLTHEVVDLVLEIHKLLQPEVDRNRPAR